MLDETTVSEISDPDPGWIPRVSVCLPVYNGSEFLENGLRSVAAQNYRDFEVIIVDDGSTDNSAKLAETLLVQLQLRGKIIRSKNQGCEQARDKCCKYARGEFLAPFDCDDEWDSDFLSTTVPVLTRWPDIDLVYTDFKEFDPGSDWSIRKSLHTPWIRLDMAENRDPDIFVFSRGEFSQYLVQGQVLFPPCTIYRAKFWRELNGYCQGRLDLRISLDWDFGLRAGLVGVIAYVDKVLLRKSRHGGNTSGSGGPTAYSDLVVLERLLSEQRFIGGAKQSARLRAARRALDAGYWYFSEGNDSERARRMLLRSLKYQVSARAIKLYCASFLPNGLIHRIRKVRDG